MNEILKILSIGNAVADPAKWKKRQLLLTVISGSLTILFNVLDYYGIKPPFEASPEVINNISLSFLLVWNGVLTLVTSKTVGLSPTERKTSKAGESNP